MSGARGKVNPKMKNDRTGTDGIRNKPEHSVWSCQERFWSIAVKQRTFGACFSVVMTLWTKGSLWYLEETLWNMTYWMKINPKNIATEGFLFYCEL